MESLPTKIDAAEAEVSRLEALLASADFYSASSGDAVTVTLAAADTARQQVETLMARWEVLELRRAPR